MRRALYSFLTSQFSTHWYKIGLNNCVKQNNPRLNCGSVYADYKFLYILEANTVTLHRVRRIERKTLTGSRLATAVNCDQAAMVDRRHGPRFDTHGDTQSKVYKRIVYWINGCQERSCQRNVQRYRPATVTLNKTLRTDVHNALARATDREALKSPKRDRNRGRSRALRVWSVGPQQCQELRILFEITKNQIWKNCRVSSNQNMVYSSGRNSSLGRQNTHTAQSQTVQDWGKPRDVQVRDEAHPEASNVSLKTLRCLETALKPWSSDQNETT